MQYLICEAYVGYELSWLIRSFFFYDSCDSQKMLITKVRVAALKACLVTDERIRKAMGGVWELYVLFFIVFFFISLGGFM